MSKATRVREQNARAKIEAQRAAARRADIRRRLLIAGGSVAVVLALVAGLSLWLSSSSRLPGPPRQRRWPTPGWPARSPAFPCPRSIRWALARRPA